MTSVLYARDGRIARITLNRPDRLNAIDETMPMHKLVVNQAFERER